MFFTTGVIIMGVMAGGMALIASGHLYAGLALYALVVVLAVVGSQFGPGDFIDMDDES